MASRHRHRHPSDSSLVSAHPEPAEQPPAASIPSTPRFMAAGNITLQVSVRVNITGVVLFIGSVLAGIGLIQSLP